MEPVCAKKLVSTLPSSKTSAFRYEVCLYIDDWISKNKWVRGARCPITGKVMKRKTAEVDHFPTSFKELVDNFLSSKGLELDNVEVKYDWKNSRWTLKDRELALNWQVFHLREATMRWASKEGNRKRSDGGYRMITRKRKKEEKEELKEALQKSLEEIPQTQEIQAEV